MGRRHELHGEAAAAEPYSNGVQPAFRISNNFAFGTALMAAIKTFRARACIG
jgi:hypothetical protein